MDMITVCSAFIGADHIDTWVLAFGMVARIFVFIILNEPAFWMYIHVHVDGVRLS